VTAPQDFYCDENGEGPLFRYALAGVVRRDRPNNARKVLLHLFAESAPRPKALLWANVALQFSDL